jgi:predicted O-methyltransferase YrrM
VNHTSFLKFAYLTLLSKPSHERDVYKVIRRLAPLSIVEVGVGLGVRASRMIAAAARYQPDEKIRYTGIDQFEARTAIGTGLPLKEAHKRLKATGANIRVIPGDPLSALARSANGLQSTDLLVISADQDTQSLTNAWFYVPRMLHDKSLVLIEDVSGPQPRFRSLSLAQVEKLATGSASRRRAA